MRILLCTAMFLVFPGFSTASDAEAGRLPRPLELEGLHAYAEKILTAGETIHFRVSSSVPYKLSVCRLGHEVDDPAGDEVLRQVSSILKQIVRDNDIVARYGGEEFAVILPATGTSGATALAERIRETVEKHYFPQEEIQPKGTLTISIGIATYPEDAVVLEDLIITADRALYHAKNTGRNKVVLFTDIVE